MNNRKIVCIVGPTASGKTALGIVLAKKFSAKGGPASGWNGEIISADSRQVFKKLNIGTNKDLNEYDKVKYHLIDICEPGFEFTLFDWLEQAEKTIDGVFARGKVPIVVGGTGLYVQALLEGFEQKVASSKYQVSSENYTRQELDKKSLRELQGIYSKFKIQNSKFDLQNPRRLIRAIERAQEGTQISKRKPDFEALQIGIDLPRSVLYERIDQKVEQWFNDGILEEVGGLLAGGVDPEWLKKIGLNYRIICEFIIKIQDTRNKKQTNFNDQAFKTTKEFQQMKQEIKFKTHALARRQLTWFRRFPEVKWAQNTEEAQKIVDKFLIK